MTHRIEVMLGKLTVWRRIFWKKLISRKKIILILTANPEVTQPLRFDKEVKAIQSAFDHSRRQKQFDVKIAPAIEYKDLQNLLRQPDLHIVHFIGHGTKDGLIVEGERGRPDIVSAHVLSKLFELCSNEAEQIECVILSACHSATYIDEISRQSACVIGIKEEIEDEAAIKFAYSFYMNLGKGDSIKKAFEFGINAYQQAMINKENHGIPVLKEKEKSTVRSEKKKISKLSISAILTFFIAAILFFFLFPKTNCQYKLAELENKGSVKNKEEATLLRELRDRNELIEKLREASAYCAVGSLDGENKALTLYREVIEKLSPQARQASILLIEAEQDFGNKNYIPALRKYKALFDKIIVSK
jgi:hypothetical protein